MLMWMDQPVPRITRSHDAGNVQFITFSCCDRLPFLRHVEVCRALIAAINYARINLGIEWIGYVLMPEHVHLLLRPAVSAAPHPWSVSEFLNSFKGVSGRLCIKALREVWRRDHSLGTAALDSWATGRNGRGFWLPRGVTFPIDRECTLLQKLDYVHANPVRRKLVERPEQWPWSSYVTLNGGLDVPIRMDWKGRSIK